MALSYINNKEIKFGSSKPLNGVYTPGSPTREYEPLDSLGIYLNSGIPLSYGVENGRYMSMSDEFAATSQGNSYSFNQLFAAQMMLGFKLHDRFIACDTEHKIIGTEPLLQKAYLAEITEKTLDYFKIKIYGDKTRTYCIRMSSSEVPTSYVDLTNSFDENGLNLTQTDRQSFLSYYRFYPLTVRALSTRAVETLGKGCYFLPSSESLGELSGDILSKFNAFISSDGSTLTSLGDTAFAYEGDVVYAVNYGGKITESLLDTKINKTDALTYEEIMASTDLTNKVASASALKHLKPITGYLVLGNVSYGTTLAYLEGANVTIPANCIFGINASIAWNTGKPLLIMLTNMISGSVPANFASTSNTGNNSPLCCSYTGSTSSETTFYVWGKSYTDLTLTNVDIKYWYIQL